MHSIGVGPEMEEIESFILIGGRSSRLGTDKALVDVGGRSLIENAVETVGKALPGSRRTLVAADSAQFAIEAITGGIPFIFDLYQRRGPLGGIHASLAHAASPWIFVLACDYPLISPELINKLHDVIDDRVAVVVPQQEDGRLQPLCGFYRVDAMLAPVEEAVRLPGQTPAVQKVLESVDLKVVPFDEYSHLPGSDELFVNVNTAAELEIARKLSGRKEIKPSAGD